MVTIWQCPMCNAHQRTVSNETPKVFRCTCCSFDSNYDAVLMGESFPDYYFDFQRENGIAVGLVESMYALRRKDNI